jgi:3'-phosphoadenosine 5'-phosphosulfate sulfotransferase
MTYTKDEIEQVKANLRKIQEYTRQNYCARLRERERISVAFGEMERYPGQWEPEHKHSFGFNADGEIYFRTGGGFYEFVDEDDKTHRSIFKAWYNGTDLLISWREVKGLVEGELEKVERRRKALAEFGV